MHRKIKDENVYLPPLAFAGMGYGNGA
jgi:hypothetical protein